MNRRRKYRIIHIFSAILLFAINFVPFRIASADGPQPTNPGSSPQSLEAPCLTAEVACSGALRLQVDPIWWNENKLNQIAADPYALASQLISNPYNTCGPATLAMVMNFLVSLEKPGQAKPISVVDVLRAADQLGFYKAPHNDGALGGSDLREIAAQFGFKQAYPKDGGDFVRRMAAWLIVRYVP